MIIMQGDAGLIPFRMRLNGEPISPDILMEVEVTIEGLAPKLFTSGAVAYDQTASHWYVILRQEETFSLCPGAHTVYVRPKFRNEQVDEVQGRNVGAIRVIKSGSKEVI